MNDSNNLSNSILKSNKSPFSYVSSQPVSSGVVSSENGSNFFDSFKSINLTTWVIIILILAFLGFNIFIYLAKGTQDITNFFAPLFEKIMIIIASITGQTIDVTAEGAKAVVAGTATTLNTGLTDIQNITPNIAQTGLKSQSVQETIHTDNTTSNNTLNKALNTSQQLQENQDYKASEVSSSVLSGGGERGWCYIGEDRGFRSCAQVGENDKCMSGDIFPSQDLCINPNLRA